MDVYVVGNLGKRDNVDIVCWFVVFGFYSRLFNEVWEFFVIVFDGLINLVFDWNFWISVWVCSVDVMIFNSWSGRGCDC